MSTYMHGYKYKLYPTEEQKDQLDQFIDLFRYVYNWGIGKQEEIYKQYKQGTSKYSLYSFFQLGKMFVEERRKNEWLRKIPTSTAKLALRNVSNAYNRFFKKVSKHPKFKSKKNCKKSFNTRHDRFKVKNNSIRIEGINTYISLGFNTEFNLNRATNPVITKDNLGDYYISFNLEEESINLDIPKSEPLGIDLGVRRTFTLSTGEIFNQPKEKLDKLERQRRRIQRHVTRDIKRRQEEARHTKTKYEDIPKSKRALKRELRLVKKYRKIHNIKDTYYHTITKQIVMRNPEYVVMENFSVEKIKATQKFISKLIPSVSFYDITQKMKHKCEQYGIIFIQAPTTYASTQICSNCGSIKKMYSYHKYVCHVCGMVEDRDINAAINLRNFGYNYLYNN